MKISDKLVFDTAKRIYGVGKFWGASWMTPTPEFDKRNAFITHKVQKALNTSVYVESESSFVCVQK